MLTHHLAPDAVLPARDDYLDPGAASRAYSRAARRTVEPLRLVRTKYRIGESLRVVHQFEVDGRVETLTARMFADLATSGAAFERARRAAEAVGLLDVVHLDPAAHAVWWRFPADRKLVDAPAMMRADPSLAVALRVPAWRSSHVAEYAPERSLTVRADAESGRTLGFVKSYAPGTVPVATLAARYDAVARRLAEGAPGVAVPSVIGATDDALALEPMSGVHWHELPACRVPVAMRDLGAAIARFHTTPFEHGGQPLGESFGRLRVRRVLHSAELIGEARPDLSGRLAPLVDWLAAGPPAGDPVVLLHGDCHPKNSLFDGDRVVLIDLDQAGTGSPSADVASLLARLGHGAIAGEHDNSTAKRLGDAFVDGYRTVSELPSPGSLRWHLVAALVAERAIRAVNRVNVRSLADLPGLLDLALDETESR